MLRGAAARARGVRILLAAAALAGQQTDALRIDPEARDAITEAAPPGCAGSPGSSLLIVHVGPHKTGTTSFQEYIHEDRDWIRATHAVEIATNTSNEAHEIAHHLSGMGLDQPGTDQGSYDGHMAWLRSVLRVPGTKAVISSECFSVLDASAWRTFLHGLAHGVEKGAAHVEVRVVMAHRSLADAIRSEWEEWSKYGQTSELIDRFAAYSAQGSSSGEPERELHRLGVLKDTFGSECVHGVSYESLEDEKRSMADFVLCAVAGGKSEGGERQRCAAEVNARAKNKLYESPSPVVMDTLRLVKLAWDVRPPGADSCGGGVALDTNIRSMQKSGWSALSVVAGQMPQKCMSFDNMFSHHDRMWYEKAGVNPPRARAHSVCVVDQNALTHHHWEALQQLFPQCAGGGGATNVRSP